MACFPQGSTQHDDQLYNGFDARTTIGGMANVGVLPFAERVAANPGCLE
ncbi:MAG: hypothetical protein ACYCZM_05420 [Acidimicrobiales bacterium]